MGKTLSDAELAELTEMVDLTAFRVDAVKGPASGMRFAAIKAVKADDIPSGDYVDPEAKAYAIVEPPDVSKAADAAASYKGDLTEAQFMANLTSIAKRKGAPFEARLPSAKKGTSMDENLLAAIVADQNTQTVDGAGNVIVAKATGDMPDMPGDPEWEAADAARGQAIAKLLAQALSMMSDACASEQAELAAGAEDSDQDVWNLECAMNCLDSVLGIVAAFSVTEAQEGSDAAADMADADGAMKAGKRLSADSMTHLKAARDHINTLIGADDDDSGNTGSKNGADKGGDDSEDTEVTKAELDAFQAEQDQKIADAVAKALADAAASSTEGAPDGVAATDTTDAATKAAEGTPEAAPAAGAPLDADAIKAILETVVKAELDPLRAKVDAIAAQDAKGIRPHTGALPAGLRELGATGETTMAGVAKALEGKMSPQQLDETMQELSKANLVHAMNQG